MYAILNFFFFTVKQVKIRLYPEILCFLSFLVKYKKKLNTKNEKEKKNHN